MAAVGAALFLGLGIGWPLGRRRMHGEMQGDQVESVGPVPDGVSTGHLWYDKPVLVDPATPLYIYTCKRVGCYAKLRRRTPRRGV